MKRFPSIKKNSDFQNIYRNGKSYANRLLVMYVMRNGYIREQKGRQQRGTSPYCQTDAGDIPAE